jgi:hypothetical protein
MMGVDLSGQSATNEKGQYYHCNYWWWRLIWTYVCEVCENILTKEEMEAGLFNVGEVISGKKASGIALRLREQMESGATEAYVERRKAAMAVLPDEPCFLCKGAGERHDEFVDGPCNGCDGKGNVRPVETQYQLSCASVLRFLEFCEASGGFRID